MTSRYLDLAYLSEARFQSYRAQCAACIEASPARILDVGVGAGVVPWLLRRRGVSVVTVDLDVATKPDIAASITALPVRAGCCDLASAFQTLEHIEWDRVPAALAEMARVSMGAVVFSVPDHAGLTRVSFECTITVKGRGIRVVRRQPLLTGLSNPSEHFWEIGVAGVTVDRVLEVVREAGLECDRHYLAAGYQHFFECRHIGRARNES